MSDNVWRLFFSQAFRSNQFYFESEVKFTGSTFHKPNLNWIQKCTADSLDGTLLQSNSYKFMCHGHVTICYTICYTVANMSRDS